MLSERNRAIALYVNKASQEWVVRDPEGRFWTVPGDGSARTNQRERFFPTEETELEPVPDTTNTCSA